jgi:hypothetical protein
MEPEKGRSLSKNRQNRMSEPGFMGLIGMTGRSLFYEQHEVPICAGGHFTEP